MPTHAPIRSQAIELLVAYQQNPSVALRNQLVRLNTGLVRKVAYRLSQQCSEAFEDLEQIGYLGLIQAIERFDPSKGNTFSTFAVPYVRGEILHYLRDRSGTVKIPRRWQDLQRSAKKIQSRLAQQLNRQPHDDEIAAELNISTTEWQEVKLAIANRSLVSLDAPVKSYDDGSTCFGDLLPDPEVQKLLQWEEDRAQLQLALSQIERNTRTIIELVYFQKATRREVADRVGISPMTVTRRLKRGLEELRAILTQPEVGSLEAMQS
jgi:RNA polymerase sigma-B factor